MRIAEVAFRDVEKIIRRAFPGAKSRRTVKIEQRNSYNVRDYWDGGSRNECRFLNLSTMEIINPASVQALTTGPGNPFGLPNGDVELTPGFIVIENVIFCGKNLGYRIYVSDAKLLEPIVKLPILPVDN
jgi:hypothetical protein